MAEILVKANDYIHPDSDKDRRGVHKRGDIINIKPDGWSNNPNWITSAYPYSKTGSFVLIKIPELTEEEIVHLRDPWADEFVYEIIDEVPDDGVVNLKIYEKNIGVISRANTVTGDKAEKVKEALSAWNCLKITQGKEEVTFTFRLFDAIKSAKFWNDTPEKLAEKTFTLGEYDGKERVATMTVKIPEAITEEKTATKVTQEVEKKVTAMMGANMVSVDAEKQEYTIAVSHAEVLDSFKRDVKMLQQTYTRHRHCVDSATMSLAIVNGGIITMTAEDFQNCLQDKMV